MGERTVALLPCKMAFYPSVFLNVLCGCNLHLLDQIRFGLVGPFSDEKMDMVWHAIDRQHFVVSILDNACDVFFQLFTEIFMNEAFSTSHREDEMDVDLGVCSSHGFLF